MKILVYITFWTALLLTVLSACNESTTDDQLSVYGLKATYEGTLEYLGDDWKELYPTDVSFVIGGPIDTFRIRFNKFPVDSLIDAVIAADTEGLLQVDTSVTSHIDSLVYSLAFNPIGTLMGDYVKCTLYADKALLIPLKDDTVVVSIKSPVDAFYFQNDRRFNFTLEVESVKLKGALLPVKPISASVTGLRL